MGNSRPRKSLERTSKDASVAIKGLEDLVGLDVDQLYAVYLGIARADWNWRRMATYGKAEPPPGHAQFRPLPFAVFEQRMVAAEQTVGGGSVLRQRLSRQAAAYGVCVDEACDENTVAKQNRAA